MKINRLEVSRNHALKQATIANDTSYGAARVVRVICTSLYPLFALEPNLAHCKQTLCLLVIPLTVVAVSTAIFSGTQSPLRLPFPKARVLELAEQAAIYTTASIVLPLCCSTPAERVETMAIFINIAVVSVFCHFLVIFSLEVDAERKNNR